MTLKQCSEEARGEPGYAGIFATKDQVVVFYEHFHPLTGSLTEFTS